jgi:regulatory protein
LGYVDDERVAALYVRERYRRGFGNRHILINLRKKGVSDDVIEAAFSECDAVTREPAAAESAVEKKRRTFQREADSRKRREKMVRFLQSRGFSYSVIWDTVQRDDFSR